MNISLVKRMLPYLGFCLLAFYGLPLLKFDTGYYIYTLLIILPLICFASGLLYTLFNQFVWYYALGVVAIFIPTIFIFYNMSATIYAFEFAAFAYLGCFLGMVVNKAIFIYGNKKKNDQTN